jgi:coenzyme F420-0:L-glutamate ligase/coenzyme F420-1:gamma-L-glutamate ligase
LIKTPSLNIVAIPGIPLIKAGDDLAHIVVAACKSSGNFLENGDVLVISSKIVSKSEGRLFDLRDIIPSERALQVAQETQKDPRLVELVLQESEEVSRARPGVLVTRHRLGFVSANSGIDQSNVGADSDDCVLLLPHHPDASAEALRRSLSIRSGVDVGIVISDSHGRPFRLGNIGVAIGVAGIPALIDLRGQPDLFGREMRVSTQGFADLVASAAHLVCGEGDEGLPVVLVRGLELASKQGKASDLIRPPQQDLYR